jgi:hypothetical protein
VVLTQKIIKNLFAITDLENKNLKKNSLSSPSMAHKLFYLKYNKYNIEKNIKLSHDNFIRKSYFGGRCEVYGNPQNNETIKYFDFSGMYAQCMLETFHLGEANYTNPKEIKEPGFYNIDYESNIDYLPVLPTHYNSKLMFVNGRGNGTF